MSSEPYDALSGIHEELGIMNRNLEAIIELLTPKTCGVVIDDERACGQELGHEGAHG